MGLVASVADRWTTTHREQSLGVVVPETNCHTLTRKTLKKEGYSSVNILIIGHKSHGKDEVGLRLAGLLNTQYRSSSLFLSERIVYPVLGPKYGYRTTAECYADRDNHREEWFNLIHEYNKDDGARLAKEILKEATIYVGMRNRVEYQVCIDQGLFDVILWVDADKRKPLESPKSMQLTEEDADFVVDNNGTKGELQQQLIYYAQVLQNQSLCQSSTLTETFHPLTP